MLSTVSMTLYYFLSSTRRENKGRFVLEEATSAVTGCVFSYDTTRERDISYTSAHAFCVCEQKPSVCRALEGCIVECTVSLNRWTTSVGSTQSRVDPKMMNEEKSHVCHHLSLLLISLVNGKWLIAPSRLVEMKVVRFHVIYHPC